jgi:hypothetical protein
MILASIKRTLVVMFSRALSLLYSTAGTGKIPPGVERSIHRRATRELLRCQSTAVPYQTGEFFNVALPRPDKKRTRGRPNC